VAIADQGAETWDAVVRTADQALNVARHTGRNRVVGPDGVSVVAA